MQNFREVFSLGALANGAPEILYAILNCGTSFRHWLFWFQNGAVVDFESSAHVPPVSNSYSSSLQACWAIFQVNHYYLQFLNCDLNTVGAGSLPTGIAVRKTQLFDLDLNHPWGSRVLGLFERELLGQDAGTTSSMHEIIVAEYYQALREVCFAEEWRAVWYHNNVK